MYIGDVETGSIIFRVNARVLRVSLARFANITHRCDAHVNAPRPENLGRVIRIREVTVVAFKIVDAHGRSVGQMRPLLQTREMGGQSTGLLSRCSG